MFSMTASILIVMCVRPPPKCVTHLFHLVCYASQDVTDTKFYQDRLYYWKVKWVVSTVGRSTREGALSLVLYI